LIALQIKARNYPEGADDIVVALLRSLKPYRGSKLSAGITFLLRLLRGVVPSPPTTRKIGEQSLLYAARGLTRTGEIGTLGGNESLGVFDAIAGVGDEVRSEFVAGIISSERKLIREKNARLAQLGAELATRSGDISHLHTRHFWSLVSRGATAICGDDLHNATLQHANVALVLWPGTISMSSLADVHGVRVAFRPIERTLFSSSDAPIRQLLAAITVPNAARAANGWRELEELGAMFAKQSPPWVTNAPSAEIALCENEIVALARQSLRSSRQAADIARAAIWTVSACTFEALERLRNASDQGTEAVELYLRNLSLSRDSFFQDMAATLAASRSAGDDNDASVAAARLSLPGDWTAILTGWMSGKSSALTFV
jgi:hypothetical protein